MRSRFRNGQRRNLSLSPPPSPRPHPFWIKRVWTTLFKNLGDSVCLFSVYISPQLDQATVHNQTVLTNASPDRCLRCLTSSMRSSKNPVWAKRRRNWEELAVQFNKSLLSVCRHSISNPMLTCEKGGNSVMYVLLMSRIIWRENWTQRSTKPTATAKRKKSSSWSSDNWRSKYIPILCRCWYSCLYAWGFSVSRSRKLMMFLKSAQSFGHIWYSLQIVCKSSGDISWDSAIIIINSNVNVYNALAVYREKELKTCDCICEKLTGLREGGKSVQSSY